MRFNQSIIVKLVSDIPEISDSLLYSDLSDGPAVPDISDCSENSEFQKEEGSCLQEPERK